MKNSEYKSIFDEVTNLEFEIMLEECGFKYTKVDGEGGLYVGGERIKSEMFREEYKSSTSFYLKKSIANKMRKVAKFDIQEEYYLVA